MITTSPLLAKLKSEATVRFLKVSEHATTRQQQAGSIRQLMQFNHKPRFPMLCMEHHVHVFENALHGGPCPCGNRFGP